MAPVVVVVVLRVRVLVGVVDEVEEGRVGAVVGVVVGVVLEVVLSWY